MKELLTAIALKTDSSFSFQSGKKQKMTLEISHEHYEKLLKLLGYKGFILHLTILSYWKNTEGLPSAQQLSDITGLNTEDIYKEVNKLINVKIDDVYLYNRTSLSQKNINKDNLYFTV